MAVFAILYPGEMGASIGALLSSQGHEVITVLAGRSDATRARANDLGFQSAKDFAQIALRSDYVLSVVPPDAVLSVAREYTSVAQPNSAPFIDLNAKSLEQLGELAKIFKESNALFVNGCIIGIAKDLKTTGRIYYSGAPCSALEQHFENVLWTKHLGEDLTRATALKMSFAAFNKCIAASILEMAAAANSLGVLDALISELEELLPGTISDFSPLLASYPRHAARRAIEMEKVAEMLDMRAISHRFPSAAASVFEELSLNEEFTSVEEGASLRKILNTAKLA